MIKFPAQFHNFRKTTIGDNLVSLSIDRAYSQDVIELVGKEIGTEFIVYLEEVTSETNITEDSVELKTRFRNKMHALISELATLKQTEPKAIKDVIRAKLIEQNVIVKSTSELSLKGYGTACNILDEMIGKHGN